MSGYEGLLMYNSTKLQNIKKDIPSSEKVTA